MQSASTFFAFAVVAALCSANPQYEYQPFTGYHYPELPAVDQGHGYFYDQSIPLFQPSHFPYQQQSRSAICVLTNTSTSAVNGEVRLFQGSPSEHVVISGLVRNLFPAGLHGFHVHTEGKLGNDCKDAGPHFNPENNTHGAPEDKVKHYGDLGNIEALGDGNAHFAIVSELLSLSPGHTGYAVGRAIVVHEKPDDLGKGGDEESLKTGNAGARVACCVIRPLHY